jgi:uncharacterized delta-60 repeat protein
MTPARSVCVGMLLLLPLSVMAQQAGDRDPTFGTNGLVTTDIGGDNDEGQDVALQPDGKIVLAGYSLFVEGGVGVTKFAVARYLPDGGLDPGFGNGGVVLTPFENSQNALAKTVALQPDGGIIAAGYTISHVGTTTTVTFALARYLPDGTLDTTFSGDGKVALDLGFGEIAELAVQPDGKIVAAGPGGLARFNADGTLDPTFGNAGVVPTNFESWSVTLQSDGKIVTAGVFTNTDPFSRSFAVGRFLPNGSLDPTFGTGGRVITSVGGKESNAAAVIVQPDGKIIAAGVGPDPIVGATFALVRYEQNGTLDATFGGDGIVTTNFGTPSGASDVNLQADGRIVASGFGGLARYLPDGSLDVTFGGDGIVNDFGGSGLVIQPDGKLVVGGWFNPTGQEGDFDFGVARYLAVAAGIGPPTSKEQCKNDGWRTFTIPRSFVSQGDCIDFVNAGS